ncbi:hypothetical protein [Simplicispira lacusdiani]|uniref:hypothetical protein n=1 Tax=Simplicispira lacusdiani TaxID=2213010 RepID=UPI000E7365E2|nr:hypothetical protein [Simplicispira lacusdiani]
MKRVLALLVAVVGVLGVSSVGAQTRYHCRDSSGNALVLSRPCPSEMRTTAVVSGSTGGSYGRNHEVTSIRPAPDVPEHHQYMSARCRALDENMRSAYSRGIKPDVVAGMRREYRRDCSEEEEAAYSQASRERHSQREQRREEEKSARLEAQVSREQDERFRQQCAESRRILAAKRARTDLTDGEKNDLRRFEEAFIARCKR